jgi:hypothetical protein
VARSLVVSAVALGLAACSDDKSDVPVTSSSTSSDVLHVALDELDVRVVLDVIEP